MHMAIVETWWGSTEYINPGNLKVELGPTGYTLQGSIVHQSPTIITAKYFINAQRNNFGRTGCVSAPVALFSGTLRAHTKGSLMMDGDPRTTHKHTLRQRVYLADRLVSQSDRSVEIVDIKGDFKEKTVQLGPLAFDPCNFSTAPGVELRIELIVELDPWYHKTPINGCTYQGLLQLPQWGLIHGVNA
jgi:hypothetical protein